MWAIPEWVMTIYPLILGLALILAPYFLKRHLHLLMCLFWTFVTFGIAENNITLTAVPVYATVAFLHAGNYLLVKGTAYK
jgi:hypothetical protein